MVEAPRTPATATATRATVHRMQDSNVRAFDFDSFQLRRAAFPSGKCQRPHKCAQKEVHDNRWSHFSNIEGASFDCVASGSAELEPTVSGDCSQTEPRQVFAFSAALECALHVSSWGRMMARAIAHHDLAVAVVHRLRHQIVHVLCRVLLPALTGLLPPVPVWSRCLCPATVALRPVLESHRVCHDRVSLQVHQRTAKTHPPARKRRSRCFAMPSPVGVATKVRRILQESTKRYHTEVPQTCLPRGSLVSKAWKSHELSNLFVLVIEEDRLRAHERLQYFGENRPWIHACSSSSSVIRKD